MSEEIIKEKEMSEEIINELKKLKAQVSYMTNPTSRERSPYESDEVGELYSSLAKAQLEMEVAKTDSINPFFKSKYSDLAGIVKASRPYLSKNGLAVIQRVLPDSKGQLCLYTRLCHCSGQWMESYMPITPPKSDVQAIGSYITYLRRYNYASIVGVVASDEDDDGHVASEDYKKTPHKVYAAPTEVKKNNVVSSETLNKDQLKLISDEIGEDEDLLDSVLKGFKIQKLSSIPESAFVSSLSKIRKIKMTKGS